jgi:acetylornithine deacetylase/succinyl-diaminopimelate desuccinylase-like protein
MSIDPTLQKLFDLVDQHADELIAWHQRLVQCATVNTGAAESGNEIEACRILAEWLSEAGIESTIVESAPTRGNLVASIGQTWGRSLMLMSHVDVVPVEDPSRWQHPPFSGAIVDGTIFGRGSDDAKSLASTGAMALILLQRAGINLGGELRFLAAADEEAGGRYGIGWLARNRPDLVGTTYAINEGGGMPLEAASGLIYTICVGEKGRLEAHFTCHGRSGHGAIPWMADNALYKLSQLIERIRAYEPEIDINLPIFQNLHLFGIDETVTAATLDDLIARLRESDPPVAKALLTLSRMSIAPTMVNAGIKSNSIPAAATLVCDIRSLPHQDEAYVRAELEKLAVGIDGVDLRLDVTAVSNASPFDTEFVARIEEATQLALGRSDIHWLSGLTVGFTDSREVRPLGTEVYGFSPLLPGSDPVRSGVHGVNESFEIDNLIFRTKMQIALAVLTLGVEEA